MLTQKEHNLNRKHAIEKAFGTQGAFAQALGISRVGLYKAITCQTKNRIMHEHIARGLAITKESFWPELYGDNADAYDVTINDQGVGVN